MKKYSIEDIFKYKNIASTQDVIDFFYNIKEQFKTSSQYVENMRKINYTSIKWKNKSKDDVVSAIYNIFNRVSVSNYTEILEEIKNINIISYNDLSKLTEKLIQKLLKEKQFTEIYCLLITDIIKSGKWVVYNDNKYITFRMLLLDELEKLTTEKIYNIIGHLFIKKIISIKLLTKIMNDLITLYETNKDENTIENLIILWGYTQKIQLSNFIIFNDYINKVKDKLSKRYQFMIMDINDNYKKIEKVVENVDSLANYIEYIEEYENLCTFLEEMNKIYSNNILLESVIKYTIDNPKEFKKISEILVEGLKLNYWNSKDINNICKIIRTNDLEDILIDIPCFNKYLEHYEKL